MFGKKNKKTSIDKDQLEMIQYAQKKLRQKKMLYYHAILFLLGSFVLIFSYSVLGIGKSYTLLDIPWLVIVLFLWFVILLYHFLNVFVLNRFMNTKWEQKQIEKLINKQEVRIEKLKQKFLKDEKLMAQSQAYNEVKQGNDKPGTNRNLTLIVAAGENNAIGKDNQLIWHLSDDLKRFKKLTTGHSIIMGRKTFESFDKPLPNRKHIVISRQKNLKLPADVQLANQLEEALQFASSDYEPFVIGGGEIYKLALPLANKIELTRVHHSFEEADTFFPELKEDNWNMVNKEFHDKDENHKYAFTFVTYERK